MQACKLYLSIQIAIVINTFLCNICETTLLSLDCSFKNSKIVEIINNYFQRVHKWNKIETLAVIYLVRDIFFILQVRRYINIKSQYLRPALEYNLDYRRCNLSSLNFKRQLPFIKNDEIIFVVQVVTNSPQDDIITPDSSSDYYIEYIIHQNVF